MRKCHTFYKSINHKVFRVCFLLYVHILYVTHDSQKFWKGWLSFKMADCLSKWQTCFAKTLDPKRLRKFTVYFRIDCCSLWIDPIIQNIKHIPKKSTAKSQFYNDWCPYCRVCLYDWSHVIQKDVQLILIIWLSGLRGSIGDASPKFHARSPQQPVPSARLTFLGFSERHRGGNSKGVMGVSSLEMVGIPK